MPGTYSQLLLHVVTSTKGRMSWIGAEVAERLYPYIGGVEDHVHMYFRWRPDGSVSDLMRTVKSRSSKWVHDTYPKLTAFGWQEGYSVFSVSKSQECSTPTWCLSSPEGFVRCLDAPNWPQAAARLPSAFQAPTRVAR